MKAVYSLRDTSVKAVRDLFLLCSDGLAGLMTDQELEDALQGPAITGLDEKAAELVALAHERGAPDNVTVGFLALHA